MSSVDQVVVVDSCQCGVAIEFHDTQVKNVVEALNEWRLLHECDALTAAIDKMEGLSDE
jgi:hypothetical protein